MQTRYPSAAQPPSPGAGNPRRAVRAGPVTLAGRLRRVALWVAGGLVVIYLLGAYAGYAWVHFVRKNEDISFLQVATLRWREVRREMATQQFAKAQKDWDAGKTQEAYLAFVTAMRNDPDNVAGRQVAARFLSTVGGPNMAATVLEEGLARSPENRALLQQLFELLIRSGRGRHALDLLHRRSASSMAGRNADLLHLYELQATLDTEGAGAARRLLDSHPELEQDTAALPTIARIYWETRERTRAMGLAAKYLRLEPGVFAVYSQLAGWQKQAGLTTEALQTADAAVAQFPHDLLARLLHVEMVATLSYPGTTWREAVAGYLREFGNAPGGLVALADLCGRSGWPQLARDLYLVGGTRQADLRLLACAYSDALVRVNRLQEARLILEELDRQSADTSLPFLVLLWQREVLVLSALHDTDATREAARHLATALRGDPDALENIRSRFAKLGLTAAVAEFSNPAPASRPVARKS